MTKSSFNYPQSIKKIHMNNKMNVIKKIEWIPCLINLQLEQAAEQKRLKRET